MPEEAKLQALIKVGAGNVEGILTAVQDICM